MGKNNNHNTGRAKDKLQHPPQSAKSGIKRRQYSQNGRLSLNAKRNGDTKTASKAQHVPLKVPFCKLDRVLLIGEGDFSFTASLARHHGVAFILATSYDDKDAVSQKYPNTLGLLNQLEASERKGVSINAQQVENIEDATEWRGLSPVQDDSSHEDDNTPFQCGHIEVLHAIDATALTTKHKKQLSKKGPFTKIVFNFPHTGGLSTDVNRQVRANQELLVNFFNAAKPYLATKSRPAESTQNADDGEDYDSEGGAIAAEEDQAVLSQGTIFVTLFEGEPYTLWNIRDLARHCGLQVVESFRFPWAAYPGYKHARTIGDITTGKDRTDEGKRKGAWRGEERDARCYVLRLKDEVDSNVGRGKKRRRREDGGDSE